MIVEKIITDLASSKSEVTKESIVDIAKIDAKSISSNTVNHIAYHVDILTKYNKEIEESQKVFDLIKSLYPQATVKFISQETIQISINGEKL